MNIQRGLEVFIVQYEKDANKVVSNIGTVGYVSDKEFTVWYAMKRKNERFILDYSTNLSIVKGQHAHRHKKFTSKQEYVFWCIPLRDKSKILENIDIEQLQSLFGGL